MPIFVDNLMVLLIKEVHFNDFFAISMVIRV